MTGYTNEKPLVTALMPLKNYHPKYLKKAVDSVFKQTNPLWRLMIIVEPQDLESFSEILQEELQDPRVSIVVSYGRQLAGSYNTGMKHATTPFVAGIHADDLWSINAIQTLTDHIQKFETVDMFHSSIMVIDENDRPMTRIFQSKKKFDLEDFKNGSPVKHLMCWRPEKALSYGGMDETLNSIGPDDLDFPWTMAERGFTFYGMRECLYFHRAHFDSYRLTTHVPQDTQSSELRRIMTKHGMKPEEIDQRLGTMNSYFKQVIYKDDDDKRLKEAMGAPHPRIHEDYR